MSFNWTCPYCNRDTTITNSNFNEAIHFFNEDNKDGSLGLMTTVITCPNGQCKEYTIQTTLHAAYRDGGQNKVRPEVKQQWSLKPNSLAKQFPSYVPKVITDDYEEACIIKDLSPKASATLSRRCLQGILRDFFAVKKGRLIDEINAIKDDVDPLTWQAIDAVRSIGNIGAHMEKDINLIIDVEPEEAQLLIGLIEILIKDWYIIRHERQKHLESIVGIAESKKEKKKGSEADK